MLKHIQSEADVDILVDDNGTLFVFCEKEQKAWTGKLTAVEWPTSKGAASKEIIALIKMADANRKTFERIGVNANILDNLLK
ncbi:hypothetical protein [Geobacter sp.]|uniref:hypothetical protein n=1 Tax=Geobacter sp. TaxID=46610 RepID=UPI001AD54A78|nr:hypothetical protein [Geobacter sp.]CAG1014914.1 hypothetical protein ANAEL_05117 [Anaerolineales bacterium]